MAKSQDPSYLQVLLDISPCLQKGATEEVVPVSCSPFSCVWLFATLQTVSRQAPLSMGFSRQEYWSGFPCAPPGDLPNPGIKPRSPTLQVDSLPEELYKKVLHDSCNHNDVITYLEPDILECEVKWALRSITTNKACVGDGIPVELFQNQKDDAVKVLHLICQQIGKTQQWPQH